MFIIFFSFEILMTIVQKKFKKFKVQCAILETARGGILKRGIGYNFADVAVLTNIRNGDHIGKNFDCYY